MQSQTALPCDARSVRAARQFVTGTLEDWGVAAGLADIVELLASELVSNAILHARSDVVISVASDRGGVRIAVNDRSPRGVTRRRHRIDATTGRGLLLLERLAAAWGVEPGPDGKSVWFEVRPGTPDVESEPELDFFLSLDGGPS